MYRRCLVKSCFDKNAFLRAGICLVWIAGLSLGFVTARFYGDSLEAYVRCAPACVPEFVGSLAVNVLPLLISACAVFFFRTIIYPILLLRGFLLGFGAGAIAVCYAGAGILISVLLLFSGICFAPLFLLFAFGTLEQRCGAYRRTVLICVAVGLLLALLDVYLVSPFLMEVMIF